MGISDGGAHLQTFAGGDYTSYFLAHWVREKGSFTLEEGVAALTSRVAEFLGLTDRGTLEAGKAADLVIFDPETVGPLALQTLDDIPGGGTRMTKGVTRHPLGPCQRRARGRAREAHRRRPAVPVLRQRTGRLSRARDPASRCPLLTRLEPRSTGPRAPTAGCGSSTALPADRCSTRRRLVAATADRTTLEVREVSGDGVVQSHTNSQQSVAPRHAAPVTRWRWSPSTRTPGSG